MYDSFIRNLDKPTEILWDGQNPAPPKKPWNDGSPGFSWFPSGAGFRPFTVRLHRRPICMSPMHMKGPPLGSLDMARPEGEPK